MNRKKTKRKAWWLAIFSLLIAVVLISSVSSPARATPSPQDSDDFELPEAVTILMPDRDALNYLVANGWDLDHNVSETDAGITVTVIATPSELAFLESLGYVVLGTEFDQQAWEAVTAEREAAIEAQAESTELTASRRHGHHFTRRFLAQPKR
ncbi:MAG: DUF4179 domain-containing protein [Syntrophobacteria bacterium]